MTSNDLIHDAEKAVNVLVQQPEVDAKRISIIGHSGGGAITTAILYIVVLFTMTIFLYELLC